MAAQKQDINDFNRRIKEISNPRNKSYYDRDLGMDVPKRVQRPKKVANREDETFFGPMFVSMIFGALGLMFAQAVRVRYFGLSVPESTALVIELFLAFWAILLLTALTNKRTIGERLSQIAGVALMMTAGHNLILRWPDQLAYVYTPEYVQEIQATTTLPSVIYRGTVYDL